MDKKKFLSTVDNDMIIIARKYLDDCLYHDYSDEGKKDIREVMEWLKELRVRLAE